MKTRDDRKLMKHSSIPRSMIDYNKKIFYVGRFRGTALSLTVIILLGIPRMVYEWMKEKIRGRNGKS
jgi:hypothetical protein